MANKVVKSDYLALKKFNQKTEKGDIFERDIMTINPLEDLFTPGQDIIYSDSNFKFSVRTDQDRTKKYTKEGWAKNPDGKEIWHLTDVDTSPISDETEVVIKPNYTSIKDFAYYGSAVEMLRATVNHVITHFPAELYFSEQTLNDYLGLVSSSTIDIYGAYKVIPNELEVNVETDTVEENSLENPYRYLCLYANSYDVYKEGSFLTSGITRNNFQKNPSYVCGDGVLGTVTLISTNKTFVITVYVYDNKNYLIYNDDSCQEYSIRPNNVIVNEYFATIDEFEKILLNRETKPLYKTVFETPYETDEGNKYIMQSYIWPSLNNWNPVVEGGGYEMYIGSLIKLTSFHDEYDSNIIWRMLTHEAIKNLDWTFFRENGDDAEDMSKIDSSRIEAFLQLYGRQFDGLKRYIDSIKYSNNVTYDEKNNLPDYMLTDVVENSGFLAILPNPTAKTDVISDVLYPSKSIGSSEVDANIQFMRNLKINAPYINSLKGTRYGVETMLKLLGLKDDEFKITEYVTVASGNPEQCKFSDELSYGDNFYPRPNGIVNYPSVKDVISININKGDGTLDDMETYFDGIPVKPFRCLNTSLWCGDTPTYYAIPWYENGKQYDGGWYFQSKGGWDKRKCEKVTNSVVDGGVNKLCYDEINESIIYDETESSLKYAETYIEMNSFFKSEIKDKTVCYVTNLENWESYLPGITSHYFIYDESSNTWDNVLIEEIRNANTYNGKKVVYLENIKETTEGNNPHISNDMYDDGQEYIEYMNQIFKYSIENSGLTRFSQNDIDKIKEYYKFNISDLIEDNRKCDYFFNPNSGNTEMEGLENIVSGQTYASNPEGGEKNAEPAANSIINVKNLRLEIKKEISDVLEVNEKWQDYVTNVVMSYVKQMLPSTTVFSLEFTGGTPDYYLKWEDGTTSKKTIDVAYSGGNIMVYIKTNVPELITGKTGDFIETVKTGKTTDEKGYIEIRLSENTTMSGRSGTVTVSYDSLKLTLEIVQEGKLGFVWSDGSTAITTTDVSYEGAELISGYTTTYSDLTITTPGWCTVTSSSTSVRVTVSENTGKEPRMNTISVKYGETEVGRWIISQQAKKYFVWSGTTSSAITTDNVSSEGVELTSNYTTNYSAITFESNTEWCVVTNIFNTVKTTINANTGEARTSTILVKYGETIIGKWEIEQNANLYYNIVSEQNIDGYAHDTIIITADTNMVGTFYIIPSSTSVTATISEDGKTITVSGITKFEQTSGASANINTRSYSFDIKLSSTASTPIATTTIIQTANAFMWKVTDIAYNSQYSIFPDATYHEYTFEIVSNYPTLKFVETSWISVDNSEPGKVMVTIDANDTTSYRNHGITVYTGTSAAYSAVGVLVVRQSAAPEFKVNLKVDFSTNPQPISSGTTSFAVTTAPTDTTKEYTISVNDTVLTSTTGSYIGSYECGVNIRPTSRMFTVKALTGDTVLETVTIEQKSQYDEKTVTLKINGNITINNGTNYILNLKMPCTAGNKTIDNLFGRIITIEPQQSTSVNIGEYTQTQLIFGDILLVSLNLEDTLASNITATTCTVGYSIGGEIGTTRGNFDGNTCILRGITCGFSSTDSLTLSITSITLYPGYVPPPPEG